MPKIAKIKVKDFKDVITSASAEFVVRSMQKLNGSVFTRNELIDTENWYFHDAVKRIKKINVVSNSASTKSRRYGDLSNYIAASTVQHTFDSWNYIANGVNAMINGDLNTAIHLVYYGEVRALMAMYANESIGVFDDKHFFCDDRGKIGVFNGKTHTVLNSLLQEWDKNAKSLDNLSSCISFNGISFKEFIDFTGMNSTGSLAREIFSGWLKTWVFDLKLNEDSTLRNKVSYRPNFIYHETGEEIVDKIRKIWSYLEPSGSNRFEYIDLLLIRLALWKSFSSKYHGKHKVIKYSKFMTQILESAGLKLPPELENIWARIPDKSENIILSESNLDRNSRNMNLLGPIPMLCRAIVLARLATGLTRRLLDNAGVEPSNLNFWWHDLALKFGFISSPKSISDASELHADVKESIVEISIPTPFNVLQFHRENGSDLSKLHQFQRVAFWGLGL